MADVPHELFENEPNPNPNPNDNKLRALSVLCLIIGSIYSISKHEAGGIVFSIIGLIILLFTFVRPSDFMPKFVPRSTVYVGNRLRAFYQKGDKIVRVMMIALCVGGSAAICKFGIQNFSLLPEGLDVAVKRLGPALAGSSIFVYPAFVLSKRVYILSEWRDDFIVRRYEVAFYVAVTLFCLSLFVTMACFKMEDYIPSAASENSWIYAKNGKSRLPGFDTDLLGKFLWFCCIWSIWAIGLGSCLLLRFFDRTWRTVSSNPPVFH